MSNHWPNDIDDFHRKFGIEYDGRPRMLADDVANFRIGFMKEELDEYILASSALREAVKEKDEADITHWLEQQLDALIDLIYVAIGTAHLHGFDWRIMEYAWNRVQNANMAKERATGADDERSKRQHVLDVVKPKGWKPPSHKDLVENHAHRKPK